jgi:hypothetical protein
MPNIPSPSRASCVPHVPEPVREVTRSPLSLDVLNLDQLIDIYAESRAVEDFEASMRTERQGFLGKVSGFFHRSVNRLGRDGYIGTKKREFVAEIKSGLQKGQYTEEFLRSHVRNSDAGIVEKAYLEHESLAQDVSVSEAIQEVVDAWMSAPAGSAVRTQKALELKDLIDR